MRTFVQHAFFSGFLALGPFQTALAEVNLPAEPTAPQGGNIPEIALKSAEQTTPEKSTVAELNLFEVLIIPSDEEMTLSAKRKFETLLQQAIEIELIRLTGSKEVLQGNESKVFLSKPKTWLERYRTEPRKIDGVIVGEQWIFEFHAERLYEAFQKNGLLVWPAEKRPKTLVFGSQLLDKAETRFTEQVLLEQPVLNIQPVADRFGLSIQVPKREGAWVFPVNKQYSDNAAARLEIAAMDYALSYQFIYDAQGREIFTWELFDQEGQVVLVGDEMTDTPERAFNQEQIQSVFEQIINYYSSAYRDQASVLGFVTLQLNNVTQLSDLTAIESVLQKAKPKLHSVFLSSLYHHQATFDIEYQGDFAGVLSLIEAQLGVEIEDNDAVIGRISARMVESASQAPVVTVSSDQPLANTPPEMEAPPTQLAPAGLIDLTRPSENGL